MQGEDHITWPGSHKMQTGTSRVNSAAGNHESLEWQRDSRRHDLGIQGPRYPFQGDANHSEQCHLSPAMYDSRKGGVSLPPDGINDCLKGAAPLHMGFMTRDPRDLARWNLSLI